MKIRCHYFTPGKYCGIYPDCPYGADDNCFTDVDIPTPDLIAELERRRPCKRCEHWRHNATPCKTCFWKGLWNMGEALHTDNFKEAA